MAIKLDLFPSDRRNESLMIYSSELTPDMLANNIRSNGALKRNAKILRDAVTEFDFGLDDKICDAQELKNAWTSTKVPYVVLTLLSSLCNITKSRILHNNTINSHCFLNEAAR